MKNLIIKSLQLIDLFQSLLFPRNQYFYTQKAEYMNQIIILLSLFQKILIFQKYNIKKEACKNIFLTNKTFPLYYHNYLFCNLAFVDHCSN